MERSNQMQKDLDSLCRAVFGVSNSEATSQSICVRCKKTVDPATEFNDEVSAREFTITSLCQGCQDVIFTDPDEEG
jgi:hypothetical protein